MKNQGYVGVVLAGALLCGSLASHAKTQSSTRWAKISCVMPVAQKAHIDIVFAIDCSGSMGPVIETAKQKVRTIVNEVAKAKPSPILRIGLIGYGNGDQSYRKFDLSDDLDEVYKNLSTFKDEGWSDEYVGRVIQKSLGEMSWSNSRKNLKIVYVVGNETAQQGPVDYRKSAPQASKKRVVVNAIYCGESGGEETWQEFARLGKGEYLHIAGDGGAINIPTPYDAELQKLNSSINRTYVAYGARGSYGAANQAAQDVASESVGGAANGATRAQAKTARQYNNSSWDLVDASREPGFNLGKIKNEDLPPTMRSMNMSQRKGYLAKKTAERAQVQSKIKVLAAKRALFIEREMKKSGKNPDKSFDNAVQRSLRKQGAQSGFTFGKRTFAIQKSSNRVLDCCSFVFPRP